MKVKMSKKLVSLTLAAVMLLGLAMTASYAESDDPVILDEPQIVSGGPTDDPNEELENGKITTTGETPEGTPLADPDEIPAANTPSPALPPAAMQRTVQSLPPRIEVRVPAIWYPIDATIGEVIPGLNPIPTDPEMYDLPEIALLDQETGLYLIDYMGIPQQDPNTITHNNFMYTSNLFFTDRFHRIVAQGYGAYDIAGKQSSVFRLKYGEFVDENMTTGLHGISSTPYQEGETMHLYLAAREGTLSDTEFTNDELLITSNDHSGIRSALISNIVEVTYVYLPPEVANYKPAVNIDTDGIETIWLYKYDNSESGGAFITDEGGSYRNFSDDGLSSIPSGRYEVVFPIYWNEKIPSYLSGPKKFSRNRYTFSDTFHFTMIYEPASTIEVTKTLSGATLPANFYIELVPTEQPVAYRALENPEPEVSIFPIILNAQNADSFEGGVYRWTVSELPVGTYTATEYNYAVGGMRWSGVATVTKAVPDADRAEGSDFDAVFELSNAYTSTGGSGPEDDSDDDGGTTIFDNQTPLSPGGTLTIIDEQTPLAPLPFTGAGPANYALGITLFGIFSAAAWDISKKKK